MMPRSPGHLPEKELYDKYGFELGSSEVYHQEEEQQTNLSQQEIDTILSQWDHYKLMGDDKIFELLFHPIPLAKKGEVWKKLLASGELEKASQVRSASLILQHSFEELQTETEWLEQIDLDINRTFVTHRQFAGAGGQAALRRVLCAYACHDPAVGYCQGMSYLAAVLLMHLPPPDAFWAFAALLGRGQRAFFQPGLRGLVEAAARFDRLLWVAAPVLFRHLHRHSIPSLLYLAPWFLTLFTHLANWALVLRIWDFVLLEGPPALFRFGLALLRELEPDLLRAAGMDELAPALLRIPGPRLHSDSLVRAALALPLESLLARADEPRTAAEMAAWRAAAPDEPAPILTPDKSRPLQPQPQLLNQTGGRGGPKPGATPRRSLWSALVQLATPRKAAATPVADESPLAGELADWDENHSPARPARSRSASPRKASPSPTRTGKPGRSPQSQNHPNHLSPSRLDQPSQLASPRVASLRVRGGGGRSPLLSPIVAEALAGSPEGRAGLALLGPAAGARLGRSLDRSLLSSPEQGALRSFSTPVRERRRALFPPVALTPLRSHTRPEPDDDLLFPELCT